MVDDYSKYVSPFVSRWAGGEMLELFSPRRKFTTWRRLWLALAEAQQALGLEITDEQLGEMSAHLEDIDFDKAAEYEGKFRHDVPAHIHTFGEAAPKARGIIHLGATSQFVNDNTDLILIREGMDLLVGWLVNVVSALADFAETHRELPCLGFTHFQPAQLTTVGKRAALWCNDFLFDLREVQRRLDELEFRGAKGTTGTQASFLAMFDGDHDKVRKLDAMLAEKMGFDRLCSITGQTYSRKVDAAIGQTLAGIGVSVQKFCTDIRLLAHRKEIEEPFETTQIGSSAMAYKRNPMRCERATGIARFLIDLSASAVHTAAAQWLERTLDDSSNRRLVIPEGFLAVDACLGIVLNVARGLVVYPERIAAAVAEELPFMATENILMAAVKAGGDRQELHELIRRHSQDAGEQVKAHGRRNDLLDRLKADKAFKTLDIDSLVNPAAFIGRAPQQVGEFLAQHVEPVRKRYKDRLGRVSRLRV